MAFKHGRDTTVLFNGTDLSGYLNNTDLSVDAEPSDTTTYGKGWKTGITGLLDATVGFAGLYDGASTGPDAVLMAALGVDSGVLTYCPGAGSAVGDLARLVSVTGSTFSESSPVADVVTFAWDVHSESSVAFGQVLHNGPTVGMNINGGFETNADGWSAFASGSIARSTAEAVGGSACGRITSAAGTISGASYAITGTFTSGRTYRLTAYGKAISGSGTWSLTIGEGADYAQVTGLTLQAGYFDVLTTVDWTPSDNRTSVLVQITHDQASVAVGAFDDVSVQLLDVAKDDGAATSTGWTAHLHVTTDNAGVMAFQLEDSANGSTWASVTGGTFAVASAGSNVGQRLTSASATTTLRRYVRVVPVAPTWVAATVAGPMTYQVAYARS